MGLFSADKNTHRRALAEASTLIEKFRVGTADNGYFDVRGVPLEFRAPVHLWLEDLDAYVQDIRESPSKLGNKRDFQDLMEALHNCTLIVTGRYSPETQRNFRSQCFEETVERLAEIVGYSGDPNSLVAMEMRDVRPEAIATLEHALGWFNERPPPREQKFSVNHALAVLQMAKTQLATAASPPPIAGRTAQCNHQNNDADAIFCNTCGLPMKACSRCQQANKVNATFCKRCGGALA